MSPPAKPLQLRLPATSANLGPGFDALGLAMALYLTIDAVAAQDLPHRSHRPRRHLCATLERNLILTTYASVLGQDHHPVQPLHLCLHNEIPLGMGCGSSAAALLAGVLLANHFGNLCWTSQQILEEACRREGHPDNVAACWLGGMTASAEFNKSIITATCGQNLNWKLLLALPSASLATEKARALLPATYTRADAVANVQAPPCSSPPSPSTSPDLLHTAMQDRIHQPYRMAACPLLPLLLPLSGTYGILGVALSGAGPSVLLIADPAANSADLFAAVRRAASDPSLEIIETSIAGGTIFK